MFLEIATTFGVLCGAYLVTPVPASVLRNRQEITVPTPGRSPHGLGVRRAALPGSEAAFEPPPNGVPSMFDSSKVGSPFHNLMEEK